MGADFLLAPTDFPCAEHRFQLVLVTRFASAQGKRVVPGGRLFAEADAAALGVVNDVVFNDPALAPVRAQKARLVGGRRGPRGSGLRHFKTADGDVVHPHLIRVEAALAHVDFHALLVRIRALEVRVDGGVLLIAFAAPLVNGLLRVQPHILRQNQPVTPQMFLVGVVIAEEAVGQGDLPDRALYIDPALDFFRALDDNLFAVGRLVGHPPDVAFAAVCRFDPLAVGSLVNDNRIAGLCNLRRPVDGAERMLFCARRVITACGCHMECFVHCCFPLLMIYGWTLWY